MIIECKQCGSKFKLDEGLIREEGSKVRCSVCKSVFRAYPKGVTPMAEEKRKVVDQSLGETVTLDTHPTLEEQRPEPLLEDTFEAELAKALQEEAETKRIEAVSPDQIPEEEEEELRFDFEEDTKREPQVEPSPASTLQRETTKITPKRRAKPEKAVPRKGKKGGVPRFLMIVLIVVLLLTGGAAALLYFAPEQVPDSLTVLPGSGRKTGGEGPRRPEAFLQNRLRKVLSVQQSRKPFLHSGDGLQQLPGKPKFYSRQGFPA